MSSADEAAIRELIDAMAVAWQRGDAHAYIGREDFDRRHEEVVAAIFKGTTLSMQIRKLSFLRQDVAIADIATTAADATLRPRAVAVCGIMAQMPPAAFCLSSQRGQGRIRP